MKYSNIDNEVEQYESKHDKIVLGLLIILVIVTIIDIIWNPDVEAIGTWISSHIN